MTLGFYETHWVPRTGQSSLNFVLLSIFTMIFAAIYDLVLIFLFRCIVVYSYHTLLHPLSKYPGPFLASVSDWYGALYALLKHPHVATYLKHPYTDMSLSDAGLGSVFRQGPNRLIFDSIAALRDIYLNDSVHKTHVYLVTQNDDKTVYSIFNTLDKRIHATKRRIIGPCLPERYLRRFEPTMLSHINTFLQELLKSAQAGEIVDMTPGCKYLGVDIAGHFSFEFSFDMQTKDDNRFTVNGMEAGAYCSNVYMQFPLAQFLGVELLLLPVLYLIRNKYGALLQKIRKQRIDVGKHTNNLFSFVVDATDPETGTRITLPELWSEAEFFLPAGGHTTASTIAASLFYLSRRSTCYDTLATEIRSTFTNSADIISGSKLSGCLYLRACTNETLRMSFPVAGTLWREVPTHMASRSFVVDGHTVPRGILVGVNTYAIHHRSAYFPEPSKSQPERWLPQDDERGSREFTDAQRKLMHDAFNPFSTGTRGCAGKNMAYAEISIVLAKLLRYFDFRQAKDGLDIQELEFQTRDQLISSHQGPHLQFEAREGLCNDLLKTDQVTIKDV